AGVPIGRVSSIVVDPESFEAMVTMTIEERFNEIPLDSDAGIYTSGLLGEKYIGISNGGAPDYLEEGSEIRLTQSSLVLEKLISQFLFSQKSDE
ncbi:MAG: MCE family protein, partial [Proteobacteria bacterium]|nr:MCE family protein [Pseudomonadota bacterium]